MDKLLVLLGDQLIDPAVLKTGGFEHVFMAEDYGLCTYQKHHKKKLYLFLCSMREYRDELLNNGFVVHYHALDKRKDNLKYPKFLLNFSEKKGYSDINFFEIEDKKLEHDICQLSKKGLSITFHKNPNFIFDRHEFSEFYKNKSTFRLANFYKHGRKKFRVLVNDDLSPVGNKWSFDEENRKKIPEKVQIPSPITPLKSKYHSTVCKLINEHFSDHIGDLDNIWFPVTRAGAQEIFEHFLSNKLENFGIYEDAMREQQNFLFHSCISPFLNIGLISPKFAVDRVLAAFNSGQVPINSTEGFIRQILGWREFIRGIYHASGDKQRKSNFFNHKRNFNEKWYDGTTGITPLDDTIRSARQDGYNHHIPRLMVVANLMNLCEVDPDNIFKWFMEMYIDSADWVMVPNVYGMATYADGGLMSTKPYTCSSNYLLKMSNYKKGEWCDIVDGLYWRFIEKHKGFYESNPRLAFQTRMLDKMSNERKKKIFSDAEAFIQNTTLI